MSFHCDVYQFSKHHHATFSPSKNKSLVPFDLIHYDVWGATSNSISRLSDNGVTHELTCVNTLQ
ncbi:hypothetical protein CR513_18580, partial [Mucuna pruriens]